MPNCQLMTMASSSSSSSSSKSSVYDVFLNFRGETRKNFTDHLYHTLKGRGFRVFLDKDELDRGEIITEELKQAIKDSRLAVIIFSSKYAESRWCLQELVEILANRTMGQKVLPIFYNIKPTDVNPEKGAVAEAFRNHQILFPEKVETWKKALNEATALAGEDFSQTDGFEGKFVNDIVDKIARKLKKTILNVAPYPVGIDSRVQKIDKYLDVGGSDVRIIGIWGMVGLGKTTVAKAIFNKHQDMFQGASFLADVREKELVVSQNTLLFDVLRSGNIRVSNVDAGTEEIKRRLGKKKVLVIVDDVDDVKQLDALAIKFDSFGAGSRIIITTRDKHLLEIQNVEPIHLPAMNNDEALELLSWRAFGKNSPDENHLKVSGDVVDYCEGLPLALDVLGSYLYKRDTSYWGSALDNWKRSLPHSKIHKRIKTSYDRLPNGDVKSMFLDISCFFIGMNEDYVMKILSRSNTTQLHEQCLVTVDEGKLMMHSLIRDTGREIVREKSPTIRGKRCRLWDYRDVKHVLSTETGTGEIQGLALELSGHKPSFSTEAFKNMHELRLLKLKGAQFTGHSNHLSKQLSWLCWPEFPMEIIPRDFNQENLVDIDLSHSNIQVWEDSVVTLEKLKFLNLGYCNRLITLPDFSKIPNLERLILEECRNLKVIPTLPTNLEILEANECIALEKMPNFSEMSRMRELHLNHSPKLSEILGLDKALNSMTSIHMEGCTNLTTTFKEAILKGWSASGNGGLFLPVGRGTTDDIHLRVKKIGVNLEKEKLINEYAPNCQSLPYSSECNDDGNHKAGHSDDPSHENQSRKRLRSDPSVERIAIEENYEIMQGSSMG